VIPFVKELAKISTLTAGFFVILGAVFDINVVTLIAGLGIGGIAIALAAKESLENLLGSFTIFVDKPFEVGDYVKVMGMEGTVERVGFRSTRIRTPDKTLVTMPNKKMIDTPLENLSARGYRRVKFNVAFGYQTPLEAVNLIAKQLTEYINNHEYINADTLVSIDLISTNGIELQVIYFVEMMDQALHVQVKQDVNQQLLLLAKQHGASFTQLVLPNPVSA
jgi:MscS family membrane protein